MNADTMCQEVRNRAYKLIEDYRKMLEVRGLLVEPPRCGWQIEQHLYFDNFKQKALSDAEETCIQIMKA
jgi:hypothetical protein